ncbi:hypothetical protein BH23VER1_BH23VER1_24940 [soil metagenome]
MEFLTTVVQHPAFWGFLLGFLFFVLSFVGHWKTKRELRRFQKHLGDKLELEARQYDMVRKEKDGLLKENENLRLRIGQIVEKPEQKLARDLEVLTRAEKRLMIHAPGFAPAWESAKAEAHRELDSEANGMSIPKRFFTRIFGAGTENGSYREGETHAMLEAGSTDAHPSAGAADQQPPKASDPKASASKADEPKAKTS